jgi:hypothetical protein
LVDAAGPGQINYGSALAYCSFSVDNPDTV